MEMLSEGIGVDTGVGGLPEGGVRNDATIPAAAFRQGHPWRKTLAYTVPRRLYPVPSCSYAAVKAMAQLRRSW